MTPIANKLIAIMASFLVAPGLLAAEELGLAQILEMVSVTPPARVSFREERHNALLAEPLVLTGYLEYLGPGRMRKVIEHPFDEAFFINDNEIQIKRDGELKRISLRNARSLQTMLVGIESILSGEWSKISDAFDHTVAGDLDCWSMQLVPQSHRVAKHLKRMLIEGNNESVTSIRFDLESDEWHRLELSGQKEDQ